MKENTFMPERYFSIDPDMSIEKLSQAKEFDDFVVGKATRFDSEKQCMDIDLGNNLNAIIPLDDFTIYPTNLSNGNLSPAVYSLIGENICACVKLIGTENDNIVLSRTKCMRKAMYYLTSHVDDIYNCMILNVKNFGVFVDLGFGLSGFIHVSELTSSFIKSPKDIGFKNGVNVTCSILNIDTDNNSIQLCHKRTIENIASNLNPGDIIEVTSLFPVNNRRDGYYVYVNDNTHGIMDVKPNMKKIPYGSKVKAFIKPCKPKKPDMVRLNFLCFSNN